MCDDRKGHAPCWFPHRPSETQISIHPLKVLFQSVGRNTQINHAALEFHQAFSGPSLQCGSSSIHHPKFYTSVFKWVWKCIDYYPQGRRVNGSVMALKTHPSPFAHLTGDSSKSCLSNVLDISLFPMISLFLMTIPTYHFSQWKLQHIIPHDDSWCVIFSPQWWFWHANKPKNMITACQ